MRNRDRTASLLLRATFLHGFLWAASCGAQTNIEYVPGMRVGQGYDIVEGKMKNNDCVPPLDLRKKPYASLDSSFFYLEVLNSESMRRFLEVNAAASYNAVTGGGSAKVNFIDSAASTSSTSMFSFRHIVKASETSADHWDYAAAQRAAARDPSNFRENCGTHFIKAIVEGGEFYGTLEQSIRSETERSAFSGSASASFSSVKADASVQTELEKSTFASTLKVEGRKAGGADILNLDMKGFRETFTKFREEVGSGKVFPILVMLADNPKPVQNSKSLALEETANLLLRYRDAEKQLDSIESNPDVFLVDKNIDSRVVRQIRDLLRSNRRLAIKAMEKCKASKDKDASAICDLSQYRLAYPPAVNQLTRLYKNSCDVTYTPSHLDDSTFIALPRVAGDSSMGGKDVTAIATRYSGKLNGLVTRTMNVRIVETTGNHTQFAREAESVAWSEALSPGCFLNSDLSLPSEDVASMFPLKGDGDTAPNNYMALQYPNSKYILSATCRSNQQGGDDGYVGCKSFEFKPIQLDLKHSELKNSSAPPLTVPDWLEHPSLSRAFSIELRGQRGE